MSVDIATYVHDLAVAAKAASASLATASDEQRQEAVRAMAAALRNGVDSIVAANELDMSAACDAGTSAGLLDRLLLTPERVEGMAAGLEKLAELPDPEPQNTDFIKCIRNRERFALDEIKGYHSATLVNMALCALRLNRTLRFDPAKQLFVGDDAANRLIDQPMRAPWKI